MHFNKSTLLYLIEVMAMISSLHEVSAGSSGGNNGNGPGSNNAGGIGNVHGNGNGVSVGEVKCVLHRIEPLMIDDADDSEVTSTVCEMEAEYEEGNIQGMVYDIDESTFPYGFFRDVEYSETLVTVGKAKVKRNNGKYGGGVLSVEPGSSLKKEKKEKEDKKQPTSKLRGSKSSIFERRQLAQTTGNRYVQKMHDNCAMDIPYSHLPASIYHISA
jgi:hypothetical protein